MCLGFMGHIFPRATAASGVMKLDELMGILVLATPREICYLLSLGSGITFFFFFSVEVIIVFTFICLSICQSV